MQSTPAMKMGPYGGPGGNHWDINALNPPKKIVSIQIWSTDSSCEGASGVINGISFSYLDMAGQLIPSGPWGSQTGKPHYVHEILERVRTYLINFYLYIL